jgi:hypothetical protein
MINYINNIYHNIHKLKITEEENKKLQDELIFEILNAIQQIDYRIFWWIG